MVIRPAQPNTDDGIAFAKLLDIAADGMFRGILGHPSEPLIAEAFCSPNHDLSYETTVFAEEDSTILGMCSSYSGLQHAEAGEAEFWSGGGLRSVRVGIITFLGRPLLEFLDDVPTDDYYVQAVAVFDQHRGRGIGSALLDHAEDHARSAGCRRISLDVSEGNTAARDLYERRGMWFEQRSPRVLMIPGTAVDRMVKTLDAR